MSLSPFAGMPVVTVNEVARMRLETISFFLLGLLVSAGLIQLLWNYLRRDFTSLPRLTYGKSLGVVTLWGLLFILVLTMISGARELMTPGAWEKQGATYKLKDEPKSEPSPSYSPTEQQREDHLLKLRKALWQQADMNGGKLPKTLNGTTIPEELRRVPDVSGVPYVYVGGLKTGEGTAPLVYEPDLFGPMRLVLLTNGEVRRMTLEQILAAKSEEKR